MPFANIKVAGPALSAGQTSRLQDGISALLAELMHKKAELTSVLIEPVAARGWAIGGERRRVAAHVDVKVTAGTNSADEKARFIEATMQLLNQVLGAAELHPATYVVIDEIPADAWGYGGRTQDARRHSADRA